MASSQNEIGRSRITPEMLFEIERELSSPPFRGLPMGATHNDLMVMGMYFAREQWNFKRALLCRLLYTQKRYFKPIRSESPMPVLSPGKVLVTWLDSGFRLARLVLPILAELPPERCVVLCGRRNMLDQVPAGYEKAAWQDILHYDTAAWKKDFSRCWPAWKATLRRLCRKYRFPRSVYENFAMNLVVETQQVAGCQEFLKAARPSAILVEHDRNHLWSCLVLAGQSLGIPTYTLVHGVFGEKGLAFAPLVADKVFCWGERDRQQFLECGEKPEKLLIGGCPRLTRDLPIGQREARVKLGLDPDRPVAMLATSPFQPDQTHKFAEAFATAIGLLKGVTGVVRLHPSETVEMYAPIRQRFPDIRFCLNRESTLEESLSAADIVIVHNSGTGSDALIKKRLTVVLDVLEDMPLTHGLELIQFAGCPRATSSQQLADTINQILTNEALKQKHEQLREKFVTEFCQLLGQESARSIARQVLAGQ